MTIEAKAALLADMEKSLRSVLTTNDAQRVLSILSDKLCDYDIAHKPNNDADCDDLLDAYTTALAIEGRSKLTIDRYRYLIQRMMADLKVPTRSITVYHIRRYLSDEKARGISDRTLEGTRQVFSAYFNWLFREGLIETNPVANLGAIKYPKLIKHTYSDIDIARMEFGCKTIRDRAIVAFLKSTGCRISEMTALDREDVDLDGLECKVYGKGGKERTVYLDPVAGMLLRDYLGERTDTLPALFVGKGSDRITPGGVRRMLAKLASIVDAGHVHPHKFRRTLATNLIRHGMPIQEVAAILGHDKLDTTMQYVVLDKTQVKNSYRKYA